MSDQTKRDAKLVQYLNDAYVTERRQELALESHVEGTIRADYLKQIKLHVKQTKAHATAVERRIKQLGGEAEFLPGPDALGSGAEAAQSAVKRASAAVRKPVEAVRRVGEQEHMLKNARSQYEDEAKEIAVYRVIEAMATAVGDKDTAKLAHKILGEEEKMADFLAGLIPELAADTAHDTIPVAEIDGPAARRTATRSRPAAAKPRAKAKAKPKPKPKAKSR